MTVPPPPAVPGELIEAAAAALGGHGRCWTPLHWSEIVEELR